VGIGNLIFCPFLIKFLVFFADRVGRQQAVALWWKSKPWLKNGVRKSTPWSDLQQQGVTNIGIIHW
jgi:hypothetical protein